MQKQVRTVSLIFIGLVVQTCLRLENDPEHSKGYMGHDKFKVVNGVLVRSFPVYNQGDSNAAPTAGTRSLEYRLVAGEAG